MSFSNETINDSAVMVLEWAKQGAIQRLEKMYRVGGEAYRNDSCF